MGWIAIYNKFSLRRFGYFTVLFDRRNFLLDLGKVLLVHFHLILESSQGLLVDLWGLKSFLIPFFFEVLILIKKFEILTDRILLLIELFELL